MSTAGIAELTFGALPVVSEMRIIKLASSSGTIIDDSVEEYDRLKDATTEVNAVMHQLNEAKKTQSVAYGDGKNPLAFKIRANMDIFMTYKHIVEERFQLKNVSNAWLKGWEMAHRFIGPLVQALKDEGADTVKFMHTAEFPGSMLLSYKTFVESQGMKHSWYASSYYKVDDKAGGHLEDRYGLYANERSHWLMDGETHCGDMQSLADIKHQIDFVTENEDARAHVYCSDIAIGDDTYFEQELINMRAQFGTAITGLGTLAVHKHSVFIIKLFTMSRPFSVSLLAYLTSKFGSSFICKPATSRPMNSEVYFVGIGYHGINERELGLLYDKFETLPVYEGKLTNTHSKAAENATPLCVPSATFITSYKRGMITIMRTQIMLLDYFYKVYMALKKATTPELTADFQRMCDDMKKRVSKAWYNSNGLMVKGLKAA